VKCVSAAELAFLRPFVKSGRALWVTGETAKFDEERKPQSEMRLYKLLGIENAGLRQNSRFTYDPECPGRKYYDALNKEFSDYSGRTDYQNASFNDLRQELVQKLDRLSPHDPGVEIEASSFVSTQISSVLPAKQPFSSRTSED
jgi:hypothetical protein